jgi:pyruvate kinase
MLDSMQRNPRPTRAEASDVANAIFDGTDAIMLSGETAAGKYPAEAVKTMYNIAVHVEKAINHHDILNKQSKSTDHNMTDAICQSVAHTALNLDVNAIIAPTASGYTARMISKYRPAAPIIAVSSDDKVQRSLTVVSGVYPQLSAQANNTDEMLAIAVDESLKSGIVEHGDLVIITAGVPVGGKGTTNLMKVHLIGDVLAKGQGIGRKSAFGKVVVANNAQEAIAKAEEGCILVTKSTAKEMMPAIEKCAALITEEGGLTSHAAVVGINIGVPVIVGMENATTLLKDGQEITVDAAHGAIYNGRASIL